MYLASPALDCPSAVLPLVRNPPPPSPPLAWALVIFTFLFSLVNSQFHNEEYLKKFMDSVRSLESGEDPSKTNNSVGGSRIDFSKTVEEIMTDIPPREDA